MKRYINRELSWLKFNERVLDQAQNKSIPLLERFRFMRIFTSNLDEFYRVRVGTLMDQNNLDPKKKDSKSEMTPKEQLKAIAGSVDKILHKRDFVFDQIMEDLSKENIEYHDTEHYTHQDMPRIETFFKTQLFPLVSPFIYDNRHPFPHLINNVPYIIVSLKSTGPQENSYGVLQIPNIMPLYFTYSKQGIRIFTTSIDILKAYIKEIFTGYEIKESVIIKILRNADVDAEQLYEDEEDFKEVMKKVLKKRGRLTPVYLECSAELSDDFSAFFAKHIKTKMQHTFTTRHLFDYRIYDQLEKSLREDKLNHLFYPYFSPVKSKDFDKKEPLINQILKQDKSLIYPYQSMKPFIQLIEEAANHPDVISIHITLYRLAKQSKVIDALMEAANNGKEVVVYLELQARFDEENNIEWSNKLEASLVQVVYGFDHYKIHSKVLLIRIKKKHKVMNLVHIGTGNYNEQTAQLYTDFNLFSAHQDLGDEVHRFFRNLSLGSLEFTGNHLLVAPTTLKSSLLELIQQEIAFQTIYKNGRIVMKMNSMTDKDIIDKLYEAASYGVQIDLIVRGICCLVPQENIRVTSILGRFLEHARLYYFHARGEGKTYISSADMMTRNTEKRIEVAVLIRDQSIRRIFMDYIQMQLDDESAYQMDHHGQYYKRSSEQQTSSQDEMMTWALQQKPGYSASFAERFIKWFNKG